MEIPLSPKREQAATDAVTALEGRFGELTVAIRTQEIWAIPGGWAASVSYDLSTDGNVIGVANRVLRREKRTFTVDHAGMEIAETYRGRGFARTFSTHSFDTYRRLGVSRVEVSSGATHIWSRVGFDWDTDTDTVRSALLTAIDQVRDTLGNDAALDTVERELNAGTVRSASDYTTLGPSGNAMLEHVRIAMAATP